MFLTLTSTLIILDITKSSSNNCLLAAIVKEFRNKSPLLEKFCLDSWPHEIQTNNYPIHQATFEISTKPRAFILTDHENQNLN